MNNNKYDKDYFKKYKKKKFGIVRREKPFWYGFWKRYIKNILIKETQF